jgi:hypothetical protein
MWVMAALAAALLLLLAVPVQVSFRAHGGATSGAQVTIGWLFGLLRFAFELPARGGRSGAARARKVSRRRTPGRARGNVLAVLRQASLRQHFLRFAGRLLRAAHWHDLDLRMRLGLGDPADTGRLWALVGPLGAWAHGLRNARVRIEPEFMDAVLDVEAHGRMVLVPLQWLGLVIAFALSPRSIQAWRRWRSPS